MLSRETDLRVGRHVSEDPHARYPAIRSPNRRRL